MMGGTCGRRDVMRDGDVDVDVDAGTDTMHMQMHTWYHVT